jgi:hypothetical protein
VSNGVFLQELGRTVFHIDARPGLEPAISGPLVSVKTKSCDWERLIAYVRC